MADAVMLAHRRAEVDALNHAARTRAHDAGALGPDIQFGNRAFAVGDRVIERRNDPTLSARNGRRGTVQAILPGDSLTLRADDGTTTTLPANYAGKHLAHAYALTIHAAQGATVQHAFLLAPTTGALAELGYVALTRARQTTRLYLSEPLDLEAPTDRTPAPLDRLREGLDRPAAEPLATLNAPDHDPGSPSPSDRSRVDALTLEP
jgi:ATP-dependent exoDNAse (exonuclease V) alpha subunit